MDKIITGQAFVLGDDIDTDQIIPAQYLSYDPSIPDERKMFGKLALSGVPVAASGLPKGHIPFVQPDQFATVFKVVIAGRNFGCGSSREHAPLALAEAGVKAVVAESYARIFYRNSVNGGYVVPFETAQRLLGNFDTGDEVEIDTEAGTIRNLRTAKSYQLNPLGDVAPIIAAGGVFEYAKQHGTK
jgi:3-isopropylmalate/(R)-2-methylmalate dehydratase small subunit